MSVHAQLTKSMQLSSSAEGLQLFGPNDAFLRLIQQHATAHIVARDDKITFTGTPAQVDKLERLFSILLKLIRQGFHLSETDVTYAMELVEQHLEEELLDLYAEQIGQTARGKPVRVKTLGQRLYVSAIRKRDIIFAIGPAGTGKTYLAMAKAVRALQAKEVNRIILTRPAVEAGERLGFLPGTLYEKIDPYLRPLYDALHDMLDPETIPKLMAAGTIEVAPLAYMRGPYPQRRFHHPRRGAEHLARADEDVPHPAGLQLEDRRHRRRDADRSSTRSRERAEGRPGHPGRHRRHLLLQADQCRRGTAPAGDGHRQRVQPIRPGDGLRAARHGQTAQGETMTGRPRRGRREETS